MIILPPFLFYDYIYYMNSKVYPDRSLVLVSVLAVLLLFDSGLGAQPGKEMFHLQAP